MNGKGFTQKQHSIVFILPITLFLAFAMGALIVVLYFGRAYRHVMENSIENNTSQMTMSYLHEKLHRGGSAEVRTDADAFFSDADGIDEILALQSVNDDGYETLIYLYEGELRELYAKEGSSLSPVSGTAVLQLEAWTAEELQTGLFRFACTDTEGNRAQAVVSLQNSQGGAS